MSNKKVLSQAKAKLNSAKAPAKPKDIIYDPMGQWKFPGLPTRIPSSNITMQDVPFPVMAYPNIGQPMLMQPGGEYNFPNADYVDEYPQMRRGGLKKGKTSRNPFAINKAFAKHQAFRKPRKNVLFDPNSPNFQDGGFIETELTEDEIQAYKDGGYIVEDISVPELNYQDGGEFYTVKGSNAVYRKNNGKWEIDYNKSGNFQPLSKGDVKQRTAVLDKQAQPYFDRDYSDIVNTKSNKYADTKTTKENKPLTTSQKQAQKNFDKNFKVTKEDRFTEIQNQIEKDKQNYIALAESKGHKATPEELEEIEQRGWNTLGNVGMQKTTPTIGGNNEEHISTQFPKNAGIGDYAQRGWEYLTNPFTAFEYAVSGGGAENMPYNINALRTAGIDPGVVEGRNLVGNALNATTNLFDAGDKVIRNVGEGNYGTAALEATRFLPGARVSTGLGKKTGKYLTTQTPLKNTYKINPWAFKPNPEAYYRGVGKEGMFDIFNSGVVRSKKQHAYPEPYFSKGKIGDKYANGYFAELTDEPMKGVGSFSTGDLIQTPANQVTLNNANLKLYKQDWLQGYKEIPKPTSSVDDVAKGVTNTTFDLSKVDFSKVEQPQEWLKRYQVINKLKKENLLTPEILSNIVARNKNLSENLTKEALEKANTTYRAVIPNISNTGAKDLLGMVKSGVNLEDPKSIAEYMATHVPYKKYGYRADPIRPGFNQDYIYTGKFKNEEEAAKYLKSYGEYMSEVRPDLDFSEGTTLDWFNKYYENQPFLFDRKTGLPKKDFGSIDEGWKQGAIAGHRSSSYYPYVGDKGAKILNAIKTTKIKKYGGAIEKELTDDEIKWYKSKGFTVEEID